MKKIQVLVDRCSNAMGSATAESYFPDDLKRDLSEFSSEELAGYVAENFRKLSQ